MNIAQAGTAIMVVTCAAEAAVRAAAALMERNRSFPVELGAVETMDEVMMTTLSMQAGPVRCRLPSLTDGYP